MTGIDNIQAPGEKEVNKQEDQKWENPAAPEQASDPRDIEQLERQKKEAELRKNNLSDSDDDE